MTPLQSLVAAVRLAIHTRNWYGALALALSVPDICGWLEDPTKASQSRYVSWFERFAQSRYTGAVGPAHTPHVFLYGSDCFALRCAYLHEGSDDTSRQRARKALQGFRFNEPMPGWLVHMNQSGTTLQLQVDVFCEDICRAAEAWEATVTSNAEVIARMSEMLTIQPISGAV